jgi:hypothetical protein
MTPMTFEENFVAIERTIAKASAPERSEAVRRLYSLIETAVPQPKYSVSNVEDDLLFDNMPV